MSSASRWSGEQQAKVGCKWQSAAKLLGVHRIIIQESKTGSCHAGRLHQHQHILGSDVVCVSAKLKY